MVAPFSFCEFFFLFLHILFFFSFCDREMMINHWKSAWCAKRPFACRKTQHPCPANNNSLKINSHLLFFHFYQISRWTLFEGIMGSLNLSVIGVVLGRCTNVSLRVVLGQYLELIFFIWPWLLKLSPLNFKSKNRGQFSKLGSRFF